MNVKYYDALIIGGGLTGLRSAIAAKDKGLSAVVLSLCPVKRSHSAAAQGGMQASLGNSKMSEGDNEDIHFLDTVKGSDWGCDQVVARMFVQTAPKAIRELAGWGVPWTRIKKRQTKRHHQRPTHGDHRRRRGSWVDPQPRLWRNEEVANLFYRRRDWTLYALRCGKPSFGAGC